MFRRRVGPPGDRSVLRRRGLITHVHDGWVLHGEPPRELHTLSRTTGHVALGD